MTIFEKIKKIFVKEPASETTDTKQPNVFVDILQSVVIAITFSLFLYVFIITPNEVNGVSMKPNLATGDLLFTSKLHVWFDRTSIGKTLGLNYERGDVVVFNHPSIGEDYVKRIIGLPGEKVRIIDSVVFINGDALKEKFEIIKDYKKDDTFLVDGGEERTIGSDEYLLMGDNRLQSYDSRSIGFINKSWIKGKVIVRFWPPQKMGIIGRGEF